VPGEIRVIPLAGLPELEEGDDLGRLLADACVRAGGLEPGDVVELAGEDGNPQQVEVILRESAEVVRSRPPLVISRTRHGFVCASAGVDASNAKGPGTVILLPLDPDASAAALRERLEQLTAIAPGVIVSDSFGRAWRQGTTDVALGVAGLAALRDLRGSHDAVGYELRSTLIAVADEIAGAAELVMGKSTGVPAVIVRGVDAAGDGNARDLVMPPERDLFP
jgi:coenzyme F420-0:L-glutamate ligase/coenzyme F420-1:gamma-L-glutamate ligase